MPIKNVSPQDAIDFLNELVALDKEAIHNLVETRVWCNYQLAKHPTVQMHKQYQVGLLGILNGLFGTFDSGDKAGWGPIVGCFDDDTGKLMKFEIGSSDKIKLA